MGVWLGTTGLSLSLLEHIFYIFDSLVGFLDRKVGRSLSDTFLLLVNLRRSFSLFLILGTTPPLSSLGSFSGAYGCWYNLVLECVM